MADSTHIYTIEELKALKAGYGYTCEEIRRHCSLSISTIQKVFGDLNKHPRRETLSELSKAMDALLPGTCQS